MAKSLPLNDMKYQHLRHSQLLEFLYENAYKNPSSKEVHLIMVFFEEHFQFV